MKFNGSFSYLTGMKHSHFIAAKLIVLLAEIEQSVRLHVMLLIEIGLKFFHIIGTCLSAAISLLVLNCIILNDL